MKSPGTLTLLHPRETNSGEELRSFSQAGVNEESVPEITAHLKYKVSVEAIWRLIKSISLYLVIYLELTMILASGVCNRAVCRCRAPTW